MVWVWVLGGIGLRIRVYTTLNLKPILGAVGLGLGFRALDLNLRFLGGLSVWDFG